VGTGRQKLFLDGNADRAERSQCANGIEVVYQAGHSQEGGSMNIADIVSQENADKKIEIEEAVNRLGHIDRAILYLWVEGYTQVEIAKMFGYTREHVNRILAKISQK
jgi:DNA-directed RNA polymerase specialized sigma subunit